MALKVLTDSQFSRVLLLYNEKSDLQTQYSSTALPRRPSILNSEKIKSSPGYQKRLEMMGKYSKNPSAAHDWPATDWNATEVLYHAKLIELLALICKGKNTSTEAKCQLLVPLELVTTVLLDERTVMIVRIAFLRFLTEVYYETELTVRGLSSNPDIWRLLESYHVQMNQCLSFLSLNDLDYLEQEFLFDALLPSLNIFFSRVFDEDICDDSMMETRERLKTCLKSMLDKLNDLTVSI